MSIKQSNEITLKIKCKLDEFYKYLEEKGFKITDEFSIDDTYFIPETLDLKKMTIREILSKAVMVREFREETSAKINRQITLKIKEFDKEGNILSQETINCKIFEIKDAKKLLKAIGYKEIMNIKEDDKVYNKENFVIAVKDIKNGDNLIEIETENSQEFDTIEKLIRKVNELEIPVYTHNYFVKKAEIELGKILK